MKRQTPFTDFAWSIALVALLALVSPAEAAKSLSEKSVAGENPEDWLPQGRGVESPEAGHDGPSSTFGDDDVVGGRSFRFAAKGISRTGSRKAKRAAPAAKPSKANTSEEKVANSRSTASDIKETGREEHAIASWMISFGAGGLGGLSADGAGISLRTAFVYDTDEWQGLLFGDLTVGGSAFFTGIGVGGNYFLGRGATAAYLGADLGYGAVKQETGTLLAGRSIGGLATGLTVGVQTWRFSRVHLDAGLRGAVLLVKVADSNPYAVTLRFGVYF